MRIIIDRDAVCAGDDMNHHREEFTVPDDITIAGLFEFLEFKYIPVIAGNNVVWVLYYHERELGAYFTKIQSFINGNISLSSIINVKIQRCQEWKRSSILYSWSEKVILIFCSYRSHPRCCNAEPFF